MNGNDNLIIDDLSRILMEINGDIEITIQSGNDNTLIAVVSGSGNNVFMVGDSDFDNALSKACRVAQQLLDNVNLTLAIWKDFDIKIEVGEVLIKE